jgi:cyclic pyranopterin phosphate synthase
MVDQYGRAVDYLRVSVTDRLQPALRVLHSAGGHSDISPRRNLTYEEIVADCKGAASLGVTKIKVTGGSRWCARAFRT